jgi:DNA-binding response OmpR family regulator
MTKQRILVIEDDAAIRRGVVASLRFHGYDTLEAGDEGVGRELALREGYDLLLLDLNLPDGDGLTILRCVREREVALPVILLTARGAEEDRVLGLKLGADDYVVKPFSVSELMARVEAVLRRSPGRPKPVLTVAVPGGELDLGKRELRFTDGRRTPLSEREAELLAYLVRNPGRAIGRDEILAQVWRLNPDAVETRTVDMHIVRLREKLGDAGAAPKVILTLRGRGYQFAGDGA